MPSPRHRIQWISLVVIALAITACKRDQAPVPAGDITASLSLPSLGEHAFDPASLKGKPSLVMFVTPSCPHCRVTIPRGAAAAAAKGANVVAVFVSGEKKNVEGVVSYEKYTGVSLVPEHEVQRQLIEKFQIKGVPYAVVLDKNGKATTAFRGEQEQSTFEDALADAK